MKTFKTFTMLSAAVLFISFQSYAGIIAGPIVNTNNGHVYYLLTPDSWTASEAEAENLGGTLAIVRNPAENEWIYSTFGHFGGGERSLWFGLHRKVHGGAFYWADNSPVNYTNWLTGEPNNVNNLEDCGMIRSGEPLPGTWNDLDEPSRQCAVAEIPERIPLTEKQRALVGDWYLSGKSDRVCHIAEAKGELFAINEWNNASRIVFGKKGTPYFTSWQAHGEIVEDKILFSNGSWWSRTPTEYQSGSEAVHPMSSARVILD